MPKYEFDLIRKEVQSGVVEIEAKSEREARKLLRSMKTWGDWSPQPHLTKSPIIKSVRIFE